MTDKMKPTQSLLQGAPYTPSDKSDIRVRFEAIRKAQRAAAAAKAAAEAEHVEHRERLERTFASRRIKAVK